MASLRSAIKVMIAEEKSLLWHVWHSWQVVDKLFGGQFYFGVQTAVHSGSNYIKILQTEAYKQMQLSHVKRVSPQ